MPQACTIEEPCSKLRGLRSLLRFNIACPQKIPSFWNIVYQTQYVKLFYNALGFNFSSPEYGGNIALTTASFHAKLPLNFTKKGGLETNVSM